MADTKDFEILQGKTWSQVVRWETEPIVYKAITGITQAAPVRITAAAHGIPDGWRAAVVSVKGMTEINASNPPKAKDFHPVTVVDVNTVEFNDVNAADYKAYVSGGYLQYNTPVSLTGYTARMAIKDKLGGTVLKSLTTENSGITINTTDKTITITISATDTTAFTWKKGVYDLELVSPTGVVTQLLSGSVALVFEVTT